MNREQIWIELGLRGALEMMDASCEMCERLSEEHIGNPSAMHELMSDIASDIIVMRQASQDNQMSMEEYNALPLYKG